MNPMTVTLREDIAFKKQRRQDPASKKQSEKNVAAFDFETNRGNAWITSFSWFDTEANEFVGAAHDHREKPFTMKWFMAACYQHMGYVHSRTEKGKRVHRMTVPNIYAWNLNFEQGTMLKTWPAATIDYLRKFGGAVIDMDTGLVEDDIVKENGRWVRENGHKIDPNRYVAVFFIPKKMLKIEPIFWSTMINRKRTRLGKIECYDIAQFYGGALDKAAREVLGDNKVENIDRARLGEGDEDYWTDNWDEIWRYAIHDSVLTARLAWLKIRGFENNGVRMNRPISCAYVAEQSVYNLCKLPTLNGLWENRPDSIKQAWTAYQGGWFEATGAGYEADVSAYDLASAYPHVMWWLPDWNGGMWFDASDYDDEEESEQALFEYLDNDHELYRICFVEAMVDFPDGHPIYPAAKGRSAQGKNYGTVINAQFNHGWWTGDEINEFRKWGAEIVVSDWFYHLPQDDWDETDNDVENGVRYPLRPFIQVFYSMKLEQAAKKGTPDFDQDAYNVAKVMINSVYGKLMSTVEDRLTKLGKTGNMWNSMWAAITTAGCRMRLAEVVRLNGGNKVRSCATDGIILKGEDLIIPENPAPVFFDGERINLGDWEDDGEGNLLLLMSGVYSIIKGNKCKSTYRGNYALFIGRQYPDNWVDFCDTFSQETEVVRDENNNPHSRPYSLGEAGVRKDYSLVNDFRVVRQSVRAMGDSNKRSWHDCEKPVTFGDLTTKWYVSNPHQEMI